MPGWPNKAYTKRRAGVGGPPGARLHRDTLGFQTGQPSTNDLIKIVEEDTFPVDLPSDCPDGQPVPAVDEEDYWDEEALNGDSLLADPYYELI